MNLLEINSRLKQRPPFQMIERVTEYKAGVSATGIKCVSVNEPYFMGHFPEAPVMPGVLIIECCAQLCSLVMDEHPDESLLHVLLKVDNFKFIKPVIPGDRLQIAVNLTRSAGTLASFDAVVTVDGETRAKGSMTFTAVPKSNVYGG
ncbi:MAG: 3-hydroxyacyl-ACP dehydratase FabZ [Clostridia bacterium]|nr:3-hydroxyacyl-ACP dehydratase FabZ [Clostridia bacterium]